MLKIFCPYCMSYLEEEDYSYAGEALIARPSIPEEVSDEDWGDYLFMRKNPKGKHIEQWQHSSGCRKFFVVERSTIDNKIYSSHKMCETQNRLNNEKS